MSLFKSLACAAAIAIGSAPGAGPALAADYTIVLNHLKFGAIPTGLKVGDTIIWENDDIFRHSATARDKSFDVDLPPGVKVPIVLTAASTIDFFCKFHPGMTGTLVVKP